jgi:hypothetical protein
MAPEVPRVKKVARFTPYYTEDQAGQVRAAFQAAGLQEGDASVSDFIVRATMREVKRLQRKYNGGKPWAPVEAGGLRRGQRTMDEIQHRSEDAQGWVRGPRT